MVQDIYPHKLHNEFDPNIQATQKDVLLCIVNGKILIHLNCFENKEVVFPKVKEIQIHSEYRYLFSIDNTKYFLCDMQLEDNQIPSGYGYVEERSLRIEGIGPKDNLFAAITGKHLADWYREIGIEILNSVEDADIRWCIQQQKERWFVQSVTIQSIQELCRR